MNLGDGIDVLLRQLQAELLHIVANLFGSLFKELGIRRRAVEIIDDLLDGLLLPAFGLRERLAEEEAEVLKLVK